MKGQSNALLEVGDQFTFNGLRGQDADDAQLYVARIHYDGTLEVLVSMGPDQPFLPAGLRVPILTAIDLIDTNVWEEVSG